MRAKTLSWMLRMVSCIGLGAVALAANASPPPDELQKWIGEHAVAVRSIDAADEDFRDLEPLIDAIGSAGDAASAAQKGILATRTETAGRDQIA